MELRDLNAFAILSETLHFGRAATRLHLSQSALSKQIKRLELELGASLFERNANMTTLTPFGQALYQDIKAIVAHTEQLARTAKDLLAGHRGTLRIGFGVAAKMLLPTIIAQFRQHYPNVTIELSDLSSHHQLMALSERQLDLGICRLPAPKGWPVLPLLQGHFVAILPPSYHHVTTLTELIDKPLAILRRDKAPSFYDHLMNYLAQHGWRFNNVQYVNDFAAGIATTAAGIAWTVIPSSTTIEHPDVIPLALTDKEASWDIGLIRLPHGANPLADAFWQLTTSLTDTSPAIHREIANPPLHYDETPSC